MTQMGLNYLNYLETSRSNLATEGWRKAQHEENVRHNVATESHAMQDLAIKRGNLDEMVRSNKARELETGRSNLAKEHLQRSKQEEDRRSNLVQEGLKRRDLTEKERSNLIREAETERHNREQIRQKDDATVIKYMPSSAAAAEAMKYAGYNSNDTMWYRLEDFVLDNAFQIVKLFG